MAKLVFVWISVLVVVVAVSVLLIPQAVLEEDKSLSFKEVVFGPGYTQSDEKLLGIITELHDLNHMGIAYDNHPTRWHVNEAKSHADAVSELIKRSRFEPLNNDLRAVMELMTADLYNSSDIYKWSDAHGILHDIDFWLLDRVDKDGDKTTVQYWGVSESVILWNGMHGKK